MAEAVEAMDRAVHLLLEASKPGAVELDGADMVAALEEMQCSFVCQGGRLIEEANTGPPQDLPPGLLPLTTKLLQLKELCSARLQPMTRSLVHFVYADVLRKLDDCAGALPQYRLAVAAADGSGSCDFLSLKMIPEMTARLAVATTTARSEAQVQKMREAVDAASHALAEAKKYGMPTSHPLHQDIMMVYCRMVNNLMVSCMDENGAITPDDALLRQVRKAQKLASHVRNAARKAGRVRPAAQAEQMLPNFENFLKCVDGDVD